MKVTCANGNGSVSVVADGGGVVGHVGALLLVELADRLGLTAGLSGAMADTRERRSPHDPGRVVRDLAVMLADGGDCLSDLGGLRDQGDLFGRVASDATAWRVIDSIDAEQLEAIRAARAAARERAWAAGARPELVVVDIDSTLVTCRSGKEGAAATYKRSFGYHPILCCVGGEVLAGILRPGNAGASNAHDHIRVLEAGLAQLPAAVGEHERPPPILVRADTAGCTHDFLEALTPMGCVFSVGMPINERVRAAILAVSDSAWAPALRQDGAERDGAWVAELDLDLRGWPQGSRAICRRERPHPGAQLSFTDHDGHRFQVILTDQAGEAVVLEARHRARAGVEDAIRAAKDTGLRNLPFRQFAPNSAWMELVLIAQDLVRWAQALLLTGQLCRCEPKRLRYRLLHVAGKITRSARRTRLHIPRRWPWADALLAAFTRLRALPARG